ncbi:MAG: prohibitin family protein [Azoarcus sp.]|nr:prohibitin family protein [Azoarcus sp.]
METGHNTPSSENTAPGRRDLALAATGRVCAGLGRAIANLPWKRLALLTAIGLAAYGTATHMPVQSVANGEIGLRTNQWTGKSFRILDGTAIVLPIIHEWRTFSTRDTVYQPKKDGHHDGFAFQSIEGLTLGVDFSARYALDLTRLQDMARNLPEDIDADLVMPVIQSVLHKTFPRYTVREIFSSKRQEIQASITEELKARMAEDGIKLKSFSIGKIDLPPDYLAGMERMLTAELAAEQMKYTLDLREKEVKQSALVAEAQKVQRETAAEAAAKEQVKAAEAAAQQQVIAAQAQADAMKHILPFKEKQIKQRELEAEANKVEKLKIAQANAQARIIEATAEADSRKKLADAEAYRLDQVGRANSEQMARVGAVVTKNPLLIQQTLAEKLSDKVQVIIAPPGTDGRLITDNLIGRLPGQPQ